MRQLLLQVPEGQGEQVAQIARDLQGMNLIQFRAQNHSEPVDVIMVSLSNGSLERLLAELETFDNVQITFALQEVLTLWPSRGKPSEEVTQLEARSPVEVFLGGLQSIGSWKGFLGYAVAAGIIVWIGMFTNSVFLLIAAMLLAPFAGPVMNAALATARGDWKLLRHSLVRYVVALLVAIVISGILSLVLSQDVITPQMAETSQVSAIAVLIPLVAGAAGALNLVQSQRSSLVSGTATGVLIAAALAPPAGLVGMATVMGRWDIVSSGVFLLVLQLVAINLSGALVFRLAGLTPRRAHYGRGQRFLFPAVTAVMVVLLIGLLALQFSNPPELQQSSRSQRAAAQVQEIVTAAPDVDLVEATLRFTRANIEGQNTLLGIVYVQRQHAATRSNDVIREDLTRTVQEALRNDFNVTPLIDVIILEPPPSDSRP